VTAPIGVASLPEARLAASIKRPVVGERRAAAAGIRRIAGEHLELYTDLPADPEVDALPKVFDVAVQQWCKYFNIEPRRTASWRVIGYLMERKERFAGSGLLPGDLPPFLNGYQRGWELWVYEQPSVYYRRHMLLHEGTHAFMLWFLGGSGPPWYMEGMAELLATHRWQDGELTLAFFPRSREDASQLGRIKIVRDEYAAGRAMTLDQILSYGPTAHLRNEPYGWCWAVAAFLDGQPDYRDRFRTLPSHVLEDWDEFSSSFDDLFESDMRQLVEQWQLFVVNLDYGYDLAREAIVYEGTATDAGDSKVIRIRADRGWQSAGVEVERGVRYALECSGRYQVARDSEVWWSEPGGVTIRYHRGMPLGVVLAAVSDQTRPLPGLTPLAAPLRVGLKCELEFPNSGTLFLRINDSPAELADNAGQLDVRCSPAWQGREPAAGSERD